MEHNGLEDCPRLQLELLSTLNQPLDQHLTHLSILGVDSQWHNSHALGVDRPQNFCHWEAALEILIFVSESARTRLRDENATFATIGHAFVPNKARVRARVRLKPVGALSQLAMC